MNTVGEFDGPRVRRLRRLASVPRWTTVMTARRQSVAEHTFHVQCIALWLIAAWSVPVSQGDIALAALVHDEWEAVSGDISAVYKTGAVGQAIKDREPKISMDRDVRDLLKLADLLEASLFLYEEEKLGNQTLEEIAESLGEKMQPLWESLQCLQWKPSFDGFFLAFLDEFDPARNPGVETRFE